LTSSTPFRDRLARGDLLLGAFLQLGSPVAAEIAARTGIDWALIDLEHGSGTEAELLPQLQALGSVGTSAMVRVESLSRLRIGRALDLGANGVMVPQINDGSAAKDMARFLRYPPLGVRGVGLSARGAGYGSARHSEVDAISASLTGIAQIETREGLEHAAEIASVDGIDVLFVGPSDLSHALGVPGDFDNESYMAAVGAISRAASDNGKALGVHIPKSTEFERYYSHGFRVISIGSDNAAITTELRNAVGLARAARDRNRN
jgi:4-hydroxy-2-oxoheptanedioate aldolase